MTKCFQYSFPFFPFASLLLPLKAWMRTMIEKSEGDINCYV
jgi:hypothetical protein